MVARLAEHAGIDQALWNRTPARAMVSMLGVCGGVAPPYPNTRIWSMPTSSMMTNRMLGTFGWASTGTLPVSSTIIISNSGRHPIGASHRRRNLRGGASDPAGTTACVSGAPIALVSLFMVSRTWPAFLTQSRAEELYRCDVGACTHAHP